jgi:hypothetical protein
MKKAVLLMIVLGMFNAYSQKKFKTIIHYNFGKSGNVSFAIAPESIQPITGTGNLKAVGRPVFYADAPSQKAIKGEGSILFNGTSDGYAVKNAYGNPDDNMVMEVWVKPRTLEHDGNQKQLHVVVANGNGKQGYVIAQRGKQWVFISGGSGSSVIGDVAKGQWTHLAAVLENGNGSLWINGKKTKTFNKTKNFAQNFSVATSDEAKDAFNGELYEMRYCTFANGGFKPETDFLLDYKKLKEKNKQRLVERQALVKKIEQPSVGKELVSQLLDVQQGKDWLIQPIVEPCKLLVKKSEDGISSTFQLNNGLVSRTFYVSDNIACVGYKNLSNDAEYLRAVKPEARVCIDSTWYEVGGLKGQPENSYLLDSWYPQLEAGEQAFTLQKIETGLPLKRYPWTPKNNSIATDWPAKGLRVEMTFKPTGTMSDVKDIEIKINYEIYQGMPIITKWLEVINNGTKKVTLNKLECEVLAVNQDQVDRIHVESDYSFALVNADLRGSALMHYSGTPEPYQVGTSTTQWTVDKEYNTWASHNQAEDHFLNFPHRNLLISTLPMGPNTIVSKEKPFKSYITFELLQDSDDRERKSLGHRRLYKKLAPQTTESLLAGGITSHDEGKLKYFIDQLGELGFERLDIQAWPGISHDNLDSTYVKLWKNISGYAKDRGIIMGGYELAVASRGRGAEVDCIHPVTGKPGSMFGQSVCIASDWKDIYSNKMWNFFDKTGFMVYSMDGPYHGDPCASKVHPYHTGLEDSQWQQWTSQVETIHKLQGLGMHVAIPDWYFLNGQSSTGMGYREASANLTPQQQMLLGRQYIFDGTWHKLPTMGWMTMQLVGFYSNDPRVGLEPLNKNLDRYESQLMQYLGSGCAFTLRGNRIYDTPETKAMVQKCVNWYKKYREVLTSEIIHVSRPTGRDLDCMLHVNPFGKQKGMVVVFNPTDKEIEKEIKLPLYYTGLKAKANITSEDGHAESHNLNDKQELLMTVKIKPQGTSWFLIEE